MKRYHFLKITLEIVIAEVQELESFNSPYYDDRDDYKNCDMYNSKIACHHSPAILKNFLCLFLNE